MFLIFEIIVSFLSLVLINPFFSNNGQSYVDLSDVIDSMEKRKINFLPEEEVVLCLLAESRQIIPGREVVAGP